MLYDTSIIDQVRRENDIVEVVSTYVKIQKRGGYYMGLCPFHSERSPSFSVSPGKQIFHCFGCGAGGDVFSFIEQYENLSFSEALKLLADRAGVALPAPSQTGEEKRARDRKMALLEINKQAATYFYRQLFLPSGKRALEYFLNRGLTPKDITRFGLGYSNKTPRDLYQFLRAQGYGDDLLKDSGLVLMESRGARDRFFNRVMFPIIDSNARVVGFGGRVMGEGQPKYINSPETPVFDKSRNLYGLNFAKTARKDYMLLCEGYMDVIALQKAGFINSAASLGTAFTPNHARLLSRYVKKVVLTYDSDGAGVAAAKRAMPILKQEGISARVLSLSPHKDPDEFLKNLGAGELEERIEKAQNAFLWEIDILKRDFSLEDPEERTRYYREIARRLADIPERLERENYLQAVCRQIMIDSSAMTRLVDALGRDYGVQQPPQPRERGVKKQKGERPEEMLLTWMMERPEAFSKIQKWIGPEDFEEGLYQEVAKKVFARLEQGTCRVTDIMDDYLEDENTRRNIAKILNTSLGTDINEDEKKKAVSEIIIKLKQAALDRKSRRASGIAQLQEIIKEQARLRKLRIEL